VSLRRERDHALLRVAELEERLRIAGEAREQLEHECERLKTTLERVVDNTLFGAGAAPMFHPEDARFQPKEVARQAAEATHAHPPLSAAQWRRKIEALDLEAAERDRKARLVEELQQAAKEAGHGQG